MSFCNRYNYIVVTPTLSTLDTIFWLLKHNVTRYSY